MSRNVSLDLNLKKILQLPSGGYEMSIRNSLDKKALHHKSVQVLVLWSVTTRISNGASDIKKVRPMLYKTFYLYQYFVFKAHFKWK